MSRITHDHLLTEDEFVVKALKAEKREFSEPDATYQLHVSTVGCCFYFVNNVEGKTLNAEFKINATNLEIVGDEGQSGEQLLFNVSIPSG